VLKKMIQKSTMVINKTMGLIISYISFCDHQQELTLQEEREQMPGYMHHVEGEMEGFRDIIREKGKLRRRSSPM